MSVDSTMADGAKARGTGDGAIAVEVTCDGCAAPVRAKVSFIARSAEYTPPVIYSLEERNKLVFMIEARPDAADGLRVGQPVSVALKK